MSKIGDIIQSGASIPEDVTGLRDDSGDELVLNGIGHWHTVGSEDPATCYTDERCSLDPGDFAPLTVTAVREPEPQPGVEAIATTMVGGAKVPVYAEVREPQQADTSTLLDLIEQFGSQRYMNGLDMGAGLPDEQGHQAAAAALFDRIAELLPQQPVQARDERRFPIWHHGCGAIASGSVPPRLHSCDEPGPWRPLLVGGDPAPSGLCEVGADRVTCVVAAPDHRRIYHGGSTLGDVKATLLGDGEQPQPDIGDPAPPHPYERGPYRLDGSQACGICGSRRAAAVHRQQPDLIAQVMAELGVDRPEDVLPALRLGEVHPTIPKLRHERDEARAKAEDWKRRYHRNTSAGLELCSQRDEARAEVERLGRLRQVARDTLDEVAAALDVEPHQDLLAAVEGLKAAQPDPLVLSLPEVPEGAAWLKGGMSGHRWSPTEFDRWLDEETGQVRGLLPLLERERSVTVMMAPPREPRTWPKISSTEDEPPRVWVEGHGHWKRNPGTDVYVHVRDERGFYSLADLRELGDVREVFDDEPGGAA